MGKPKELKPATTSESYNWGSFGSATNGGVNLSPTAESNVVTTQSGINQYLNELINPSYNSESFKARQELLDQNNSIYARQLGAEAMARGARGNATQNILNSIMSNRNNDMRKAMTEEDTRIKSILSALSGIEGNYFNQSNAMANNILDRVRANLNAQNEANKANAQASNSWSSNLWGAGASILGAVAGAWAKNAFSGDGGGDGGYGSEY